MVRSGMWLGWVGMVWCLLSVGVSHPAWGCQRETISTGEVRDGEEAIGRLMEVTAEWRGAHAVSESATRMMVLGESVLYGADGVSGGDLFELGMRLGLRLGEGESLYVGRRGEDLNGVQAGKKVVWEEGKPIDEVVMACLGEGVDLEEANWGTWRTEVGTNLAEWVKAWKQCDVNRQVGLRFLMANMPAKDRRELTAEYVLEHVNEGYESWEQSPWRAQVSESLFLDWILPYTNVNESRDRWRREFRERFLPLVAMAKTPGEAATKLNQQVFGILDVKYSTQRRRPDQGPQESIETHLASCSGLSILLIDVCRSVGIPARFVGTPRWSDNSGNHSWVEIWSDGDWHFTGACEPAGDRLDEGWFTGRASEAKGDDPRYAIYAASFRRTSIHFPLVWNMRDRSVSALNVTSRYLKRDAGLGEGEVRIRVCVRNEDGKRVVESVVLWDGNGEKVGEGRTRDDAFDTNDHLEFVVKVGAGYRVQMGKREEAIEVQEANQLFEWVERE